VRASTPAGSQVRSARGPVRAFVVTLQ
jgi:hypothetical protein